MKTMEKYLNEEEEKQKILKEYNNKYDKIRNMINRIGKVHVNRDKRIKEKTWSDISDLNRIEKDLQNIMQYWR